MKRNTLKIAVSKEPIDKNEKGVWNKIVYRNEELTKEELLSKLLHGYAVCNIFNGKRVSENFVEASCVFLDFDNYEVDFTTYLDSVPLELKPTIAYTTTSNGVKGNRFRFIYIFDEAVHTKGEYECLYDAICAKLNLKMKDNCGRKVTQQMAGTIPNALSYLGEVFRLSDFVSEDDLEKSKTVAVATKRKDTKRESENMEKEGMSLILDETFENDLYSLSPFDFLNKYLPRSIEHSAPIAEYEDHYCFDEKTYMEVYINCKWVEDLKGNKQCIIVKVKDGEHRRAKLANDANVIHKICPDITAEELVANLVYRRAHFYENEDGVLSNRFIMQVAERELNNPNYMNTEYRGRRRKLTTKAEWCRENNVKRSKLARHLLREYRKMDVLSDYDWTLNITQNLNLLRQYGHKVSYRTLWQYVKEEALLMVVPNTESHFGNWNIKQEEKQYDSFAETETINLKRMRSNGTLTLDTLQANKSQLPKATYYRWMQGIKGRACT